MPNEKSSIRRKLEALKIGESLTFANDDETRTAQFASWQIRKRLGRGFVRNGLTIRRVEDRSKEDKTFFVVLWGIGSNTLEGPFIDEKSAVEWLRDYKPQTPGQNNEPEFGMVIGPIPSKMLREF